MRCETNAACHIFEEVIPESAEEPERSRRLSNSQEEVVIIGIDCATQLQNVGVAVSRRSKGGSAILALDHPFRGADAPKTRSLAEHIADEHIAGKERVLVALDAPLGWPDAMRTELATHSAGGPLAPRRQCMFSRTTDRFVRCRTGKKPLDVGANLIAMTAHWALEFLEQLREATGEGVPLAWEPPRGRGLTAIEVYPALALLALERDEEARKRFDGYKKNGPSGSGARRCIWESLPADLRRDGGVPKTDHEIDAVLCVQIANEFLCGNCVTLPEPFPSDVVRREGWIWFSKDALQSSCGGLGDGT